VISVFVSRNNASTIRKLLQTAPDLRRVLRPICYDVLFSRRAIRPGTCIFTDFDLLTAFEVDAAARAARAAAGRGALVLNWPHLVAERFETLNLLHGLGLNPVQAIRIDTGTVPPRFPVFIRCEDGAAGPDTELLHDQDAYRTAVLRLRASGKTLKRRIAVTFEAERDAGGYFRKYGAMVIGTRVVPIHLLQSRHWSVKDETHEADPALAEEELAYVRENPHEAALLRIAQVCNVDYGRVDYTVQDGRLVVFEVNTNPNFPTFDAGEGGRAARLPLVLEGIVAAFADLDRPTSGRPVAFEVSAGARRGGAAIARARWFQDFPTGLFQRRRWIRLAARLRGRPTVIS